MNSFYGNTINPSQFQFDKIYSNRTDMDLNCKTDEVFIGRYVLVKYSYESEITRIYVNIEDGVTEYYGYSSSEKDDETKIKYADLSSEFYYDFYNSVQIFFTASEEESTGYALFTQILVEDLEKELYLKNLNIDKNTYALNEISYDGTAWQKIFINNEEKYIKVADLNTKMPIMDIAVDPPTHWPLVPHFEIKTGDNYYKMHLQPNWGFRIGKAEDENLSDENIVWIREKYNDDEVIKEYYDNNLSSWVEYNDGDPQVSLPGNIYYNKAGFKKDQRNYEENIFDEFSLTPVASGENYELHNDDSPGPAKDIQEMKILLPSLGNAISDMWDLIYGKERNLDINWNSLEGIRQTLTTNGYKYDTSSINTLAGCINSVHDLMGMIISEQPENAENASQENIYWNGSSFTRRKKNYEYTEVAQNEYTFQEVEEPEKNYLPNTYFLDSQGNLKDIYSKYDSNKTYYKRILESSYIEVPNMVEYQPNTYYFIDNYGNVLQNNASTWDKEKQYYIIKHNLLNSTEFSTTYSANKFYYKQDSSWILEVENVPSVDTTREYYILNYEKVEGVPFKNDGSFYVKNNGSYAPAYEFDANKQYFKYTETSDGEQIVLSKVIVFELNDNHYQKDDNNNYHKNFDDNKDYYLISIEEGPYQNTDFYLPGKYHYQPEATNDYYLGLSSSLEEIINESGIYYIFITNDYFQANEEAVIPCSFFEPNIYYYKNNKDWVLAEYYDPEKTYFKLGDEFYISNDEKNSFSVGSIWNNQVEIIPWTVTLSRRSPKYEFEELRGFAKNYNTIHGLILKLNYLMEANDNNTRDTSTLKGAINKLNDIFFKIEALIPNSLLSVGLNGKIYSTKYKGVKWIDVELDNINHKINISHKAPTEENIQEFSLVGNTKLYCDEKGHILRIE